MAGYATRLKADITRWRAEGLIDAATAAVLARDADARRGGVNFGQILAILAAVLIGAAILLLIAANWEAFPRLMRVGMIFALIVGGYVGGAVLKGRGSDGFAEALYILAAVAFGAGIALIAQMYHLSGEESHAILIWCAGTALAALALRSAPLTAGAVLLAGVWVLMVTDEQRGWFGVPPPSYFLIAAAIWAISLWTQSFAARHLILLSLMAYAILHFLGSDSLVAPTVLAAASVLLFGIWSYAPEQAERWARLGEGGLPVQGLLGTIVGLSPIQFTYQDEGIFLLVVIIVFAVIIGALLLGGRESRMLRWLGYAAFTFEVIYVYVVLLASMIGTAGFFLTAGLVVAALAFVITRLERRLRTPAAPAEASA